MAGEMKKWLRFRHAGTAGFGTLTSSGISVHEGELLRPQCRDRQDAGAVGGRAARALRTEQDRCALE
ncbi:hypothetical protein ACVIW2_002807 [Bradyrhizobium huanghuaihaiense]